MDRPVIISIKGLQLSEDSGREPIELVTEGKLDDRGDAGFSLSYEESELTGLDGTLTTFRVEGDRITLLRAGAVNSQMLFEAGRRHLSMYETPYGTLAVGVKTRKLSSKLDGSGGDIRIQYAVEIDHALAGENHFHITFHAPAGRSMPS